MTLPFTRDEFFDVFAVYNQRLWPFAVALWMLTAYSVVLLIRTRSARPWWIPELLAIHWAWAGLAYHAAFFSSINPAAWVFSGLFVLEAGLLLWYGVVGGHLELSRGLFFRRVSFLGTDCLRVAVPGHHACRGPRVPAAPDVRSSMPDHDPDDRSSACRRSLGAAGCRRDSARMGVHRRIVSIPPRGAR